MLCGFISTLMLILIEMYFKHIIIIIIIIYGFINCKITKKLTKSLLMYS